MNQELIWLLFVIVGVVAALSCSRIVRTMVREAVMRPKERCKIEVTKNTVTVTPQHKPELEEIKHV
jgi:hypothetical protein